MLDKYVYHLCHWVNRPIDPQVFLPIALFKLNDSLVSTCAYLIVSSVFKLLSLSLLLNSQDGSFAASGNMGNRNTHCYNLDQSDQDALPVNKLMAKNFLGSGITYK